MKSLLTFLALLSITAVASAQTVSYVVISKSHSYSQSSWGTPTESTTTPWEFGAFVVGSGLTASNPITSASFTSVSGGTVGSGSLAFDVKEWEAEYGYSLQAQLQGAFFDGNYTMTLNGTYTTPTRNLTSTLYPNNPQFTLLSGTAGWSGNILVVDPTTELVFSTGTFSTNFSTGFTRIGWDVSGNGYFDSNGMGDFSSNTATITIPAGSLIAGNNYDLYAEFGRIIDQGVLTGTGITGLDSATFATILHTSANIQLYAVPEPASYAAVLGTLVLVGVAVQRRRRDSR